VRAARRDEAGDEDAHGGVPRGDGQRDAEKVPRIGTPSGSVGRRVAYNPPMRRTILVSSLAVLVAVGLIGGAVYAVRAHQRDRARELLEVSTSSFATCLLGRRSPCGGDTDATLRGIRLAEGAPVPAVDGDAVLPLWDPTAVSSASGRRGASRTRNRCVPATSGPSPRAPRSAGGPRRRARRAGRRLHAAPRRGARRADAVLGLGRGPSVPRPVTPLVALLRTSASKPMLDDATNVTVSAVEAGADELHLTLGPAVIGCVVEGSTMHLTCVRPSFAVDQALSHPKGAPLLSSGTPSESDRPPWWTGGTGARCS